MFKKNLTPEQQKKAQLKETIRKNKGIAVERFIARSIDNIIFLIITVFACFSFTENEYIIFFVYIIAKVLVETILISKLSTTPGKWLFNIYIKDNQSQNLTFKKSFLRVILVIIIGTGLQVFSFFTMIFSYFYYGNKKTTIWDNIVNSEVIREKMPFKKKAVILSTFLMGTISFMSIIMILN